MVLKGKKFVIIYLTDWQMRMIKDFLNVDCHRWVVPIDNGGVVKYRVEFPGDPKVKKMYLTDWQKREVQAEAGEMCDYVELKKGSIVEYGLLPGE